MGKNKIKWFLIIILFIAIIVLTVYKVNKQHENKEKEVLYKKIEYATKMCYLKQDCTGTITLEDLYTKEYLEELYDPITKKLLNKDIKIKYNNDKVIILD